jgi:hypothetical protein
MPSTSCARVISDLNHVSSLRLEFPIQVPERFRARKQGILVILVAWWVHASLMLFLSEDDKHRLA